MLGKPSTNRTTAVAEAGKNRRALSDSDLVEPISFTCNRNDGAIIRGLCEDAAKYEDIPGSWLTGNRCPPFLYHILGMRGVHIRKTTVRVSVGNRKHFHCFLNLDGQSQVAVL